MTCIHGGGASIHRYFRHWAVIWHVYMVEMHPFTGTSVDASDELKRVEFTTVTSGTTATGSGHLLLEWWLCPHQFVLWHALASVNLLHFVSHHTDAGGEIQNPLYPYTSACKISWALSNCLHQELFAWNPLLGGYVWGSGLGRPYLSYCFPHSDLTSSCAHTYPDSLVLLKLTKWHMDQLQLQMQ